MNNDIEKAKKVRRLSAIIYLLIMLFLVSGTLLSEKRKEKAREAQKLSEQGIFSEPAKTE